MFAVMIAEIIRENNMINGLKDKPTLIPETYEPVLIFNSYSLAIC